MVYEWELKKIKDWSTDTIKNYIWIGDPVPGCVSIEALRYELARRGEPPVGYHNS